MTDWSTLGTPLIIALIPVLIAIVKLWVPDSAKQYYPVIAIALGPLLDGLRSWMTSRQADPAWGVAYGLAAVGLRELYTQWFGAASAARRMAHMMKKAGVVLVTLLLAGCASLPVSFSGLATHLTECAIALATDAAAVAADPSVASLAVAPSIAGVLGVLTSLQQLMPGTIQACSPFVNDVQAEFGGTVVAPPTPTARLGRPTAPVPNPWKGMLRVKAGA